MQVKRPIEAWQSSTKPRPTSSSFKKGIAVDDFIRVIQCLDPEFDEVATSKEKQAYDLHLKSKERTRHWKGTKEDQMHRLFKEREQRLKSQELERIKLDQAFEQEAKLEKETLLTKTRLLQFNQTPEGRKQHSELLLQQVLKERALQMEWKQKSNLHSNRLEDSPSLPISQGSEPSLTLKKNHISHPPTQKLGYNLKNNSNKEEIQRSISIQNEFMLVEKARMDDKRLKQVELRKTLDQQLQDRKELKSALEKEENEMDQYSQTWRQWLSKRAEMIQNIEQAQKKKLGSAKETVFKGSDDSTKEWNSENSKSKHIQKIIFQMHSKHNLSTSKVYNQRIC